MKRFFLVVLLSAGCFYIEAQVVSVSPAFPTADEVITLTFDVGQSTDSRATGLLGLDEGNVFLWSGAGFAPNGSMGFIFGPPGQTDFSQPFPPGQMTSLGNDRWEIMLTPSTYFDLPDTANITYLGLLLKNSNGTAQTEDLFIPIFQEGEYNTRLVTPASSSLIVEENNIINVNFLASENSDIEIFVDDVSEGLFENVTEIDLDIIATGSTVTREVRIVSTSGENTAEESFTYTIIGDPNPAIAELPSGLGNGINYNPDDDTELTLVLTAPQKEFVFVVGSFNDWQIDGNYLMNRTPDGNTYWLTLTGLTPGVEYIFQYWIDDELIKVGDPYADKVANPFSDPFIPESVYPDLIEPDTQGNGVATTFQTTQEPFIWDPSEDSYVKPDVEDLIIYETYMGDFLQTHDYKDMIDTLDYFERLGVNAIELMPISEQGFDPGWGYDPDYMFAPEKFYGRDIDLKNFIQECHKRGIAVIQDIVLNHQTGTNPYNIMYREPSGAITPGNPFFNTAATHPFNVFEDMNHESPFVQDYVDSVVQYWIEDFHFDGYRFDLSKGFTQNEGNDPDDQAAWDAFDQSRIDILSRINDRIREVDPTAYVILEHFAAQDEEEVLEDLGMLPWGSFHFSFSDLITGDNLNAVSSNNLDSRTRVGYMESHDEQRLVYEMLDRGQSSAEYDISELGNALDRSKLAAAFFFPFPGPKMLWQWQEYGYDLFLPGENPGRTDPKANIWNNQEVNGIQNLDYYNDVERQKVYDAYAAIIGLRQQFPEVFETEVRDIDFTGAAKTLVFENDLMDVVITANFGTISGDISPNFPSTGTWYDFFTGDSINVKVAGQAFDFSPGEFHIFTSVPLEKPVLSRLDNGDNLVPFTVAFDPFSASLTLDRVLVEEGDTLELTVTNEIPVESDQLIRVISDNSEDIIIEETELSILEGETSVSTRIFVVDDEESEVDREDIVISIEAITDGIFVDEEEGSQIFQIGGSDVITSLTTLEELGISIFPNPVETSLTVKFGNNSVLLVRIMDILGNELREVPIDQSSGNSALLELSQLQNGTYLIELSGEELRSVSRFIISR